MTPRYAAYRHGSHGWRFNSWAAPSPIFPDALSCQRAADDEREKDYAECKDASRNGAVTDAMRRALNAWPDKSLA